MLGDLQYWSWWLWQHEWSQKIIICLIVTALYLALRKYFTHFLSRWSQKKETDRIRVLHVLEAISRSMLGFIFWVVIINILFHEAAQALLGLGLVSVGLGFALQATIKDYIAGILILLEGELKVGQRVCINKDLVGTITRIDLRSMHLMVEDQHELAILNGEIKIWQQCEKDQPDQTSTLTANS